LPPRLPSGAPLREMGSKDYAGNDNQFVQHYSSFIELIQNITVGRRWKTDGCNAEKR
jgi:hypothetical protein